MPNVVIDTSTDATVLVSAVTGYKIRCTRFRLQGNGAVTAQFCSYDGSTQTGISGKIICAAAGGGGSGAYDEHGHFETVSGNSLSMKLSASVEVVGLLEYVLIPQNA